MKHILAIRIDGKVEVFEFKSENAMQASIDEIKTRFPDVEYLKTTESED